MDCEKCVLSSFIVLFCSLDSCLFFWQYKSLLVNDDIMPILHIIRIQYIFFSVYDVEIVALLVRQLGKCCFFQVDLADETNWVRKSKLNTVLPFSVRNMEHGKKTQQ